MLNAAVRAFGMTVAVMAAVTPGAFAGEIVGSPLDHAPDPSSVTRTGFIDVVGTQPADVALPVAASSAGVITSIRIRHAGTGSDPGSLRFRLLSGTGTSLKARRSVRLPDVPLDVNTPASILTIVPRDPGGLPHGVKVLAGERLGMADVGATAGQEIRPFAVVSGFSVLYRESFTDSLSQDYLQSDGLALLMQFTIEPDGDHDGYGDDTQDRCVLDGSGPCVDLPTCRVPAVGGLSLAAAKRVLVAAGCRLGTVRRRVVRGAVRVVAQSVAPGRRVKRGTLVGVTLSRPR